MALREVCSLASKGASSDPGPACVPDTGPCDINLLQANATAAAPALSHCWIEGNLSSKEHCAVCNKAAATTHCLFGFRCAWCRKVVRRFKLTATLTATLPSHRLLTPSLPILPLIATLPPL